MNHGCQEYNIVLYLMPLELGPLGGDIGKHCVKMLAVGPLDN